MRMLPTSHASSLGCLDTRNCILEHESFRADSTLLRPDVLFADLAITNLALQELLCCDEEYIRVRLPATARKNTVVGADDAAFKAVEELAEVRGLELEASTVRSRSKSDRDPLCMQMANEERKSLAASFCS